MEGERSAEEEEEEGGGGRSKLAAGTVLVLLPCQAGATAVLHQVIIMWLPPEVEASLVGIEGTE